MSSKAGTAAVRGREPQVIGLEKQVVPEFGRGDPDWLLARREEAWETYNATPMPSTRSEEWRYTDIARLLPADEAGWTRAADAAGRLGAAGAALPSGEGSEIAAAGGEGGAAAGQVVMIDGAVVSVQLDESLAARGVVLKSLRQVARDSSEDVEELLATDAVPATDGKFAALNAALWSDGIFLRVPRGVAVEHPIQVTRWSSGAGVPSFSRVLVVAEEGSQVSVVEDVRSPEFDRSVLVSAVAEIFARSGSRVQYVSLQQLGRGGFYLANQRTLAERDASLDTLNVALGGSVGRVDLNARLLGPGASSDMLGLYFGDEDQHFDFNTSQDHVAPNARSDLLYKGALDGSARGIFRGIIRVHRGAQGTDAYQTNRNLVLSDRAVATSLPNLEIGADDVRCSHGATAGQLDKEALFYLMSRGLRRGQAERLVVLGFLGEVLSRLPLGGVAERVSKAIVAKLRHHA